MALKRLTAKMIEHAERSGKTAGWYTLCRQGYLPGEIAAVSDRYPPDVSLAVRRYADGQNLPMPATCAPKRARSSRQRPSGDDWRAAFRNTTMRTGLALSLTQPQLEYLCATADGVLWDRFASNTPAVTPCNTIATGAALEKRGLIRYRPREEHFTAWHELTEAGEAVITLLKIVGVFRPADAALEKLA